MGKIMEVPTLLEGRLAQSTCLLCDCVVIYSLLRILQSIKGPFCRPWKLIYVCQLLGIFTQAFLLRDIMLFKKHFTHVKWHSS